MTLLARIIVAVTGCALLTGPTHARFSDAFPAIDETVNAWYQVRGWVNAFTLPAHDEPSARIEMDHAAACCIILRQQGRVVGVGTSHRGDNSMLRHAAAAALGMTRLDPAISALPADIRDEIGLKLTVELEVAGPFQPLIGLAPEEFQFDIHPLRHGIALRWNDQWSVRFPSRMRGVNHWADAKLLDGMAVSMGLSSGLRDALRQDEIAAYRFRTIDLAQIDTDAPPQLVIAGTMIRPMSTPDLQQLVEARRALLAHVLGRQWSGDETLGLMGMYNPIKDRYEPIIESPLDQALIAWALGYLAGTPSLDQQDAESATDTAAMIIASLLKHSDAAEATPVERAALLLAFNANPRLIDDTVRSRQMDDVRSSARLMVKDGNSATSGHDLALVAFALTSSGQDDDLTLARQLADQAWETTPMERQVSLLPWMAWTELSLDRADVEARLENLHALRTMLMERQVPPGDERFGDELAGGFVFGQLPADVTSQSLRPMASLPSMLQHEEITSLDEQQEQQARLMVAAKFLLRLQVTSQDSKLYRSPGRITGGIRIALWDSRMPTAAQVMALVTLSELIDLLSTDSRRQPGVPQLY